MNSRKKAISVSNVSKYYISGESNFFRSFLKNIRTDRINKTENHLSNKKLILDNITFNIQKGDVVGIIGKNGSGKSTLLSIISGIITPNSGSVSLDGRCLALLELGSGFNLDFTGKENIYLNGLLFGSTKLEIKSKLEDIINFSELGEYINKPLKQYSSGMIVRLAFSIIAHLSADILIIDEALAVGDISFQKKCFSFLEKFQKNLGTILFVSHSLEQVKKICNNVIYIKDKKIIKGNPKSMCDLYERDLLNNISIVETNLDIKSSEKLLNNLKVPKNFKFPTFSNHYGNLKIKIKTAWLSSSRGVPISKSFTNDTVSWNFSAEANQEIEDVHFGFSIRTKEGVSVFATNTIQQKKKPINVIKGERMLICFKFINYLGNGEFFFNCSIFTGTTENPQYIHRIVDAQTLQNNLKIDSSFGILGIDIETEVKKID